MLSELEDKLGMVERLGNLHEEMLEDSKVSIFNVVNNIGDILSE